MTRPTILVVDDHRVVVEGLVRLLREQFDIVGTITDSRLAVAALSKYQADVVLLDVSMPHISGLEVLRQIRESAIACRVIMLTMHTDASLVVDALRAGADGFVLKDSSGDELVGAIEVVVRGNTYIAREITREVMTLMLGDTDPARVELTPQQREVVRLVVSGQRAKEIAGTLDLSTRTVEAIKYRVMQQLNVHSTAELVRYAIEHSLVNF